MRKQLFGFESGIHQGQGLKFKCYQYENALSEGARSKQKRLHHFVPCQVVFGIKLKYLSSEIGLSFKTMFTYIPFMFN